MGYISIPLNNIPIQPLKPPNNPKQRHSTSHALKHFKSTKLHFEPILGSLFRVIPTYKHIHHISKSSFNNIIDHYCIITTSLKNLTKILKLPQK